MKLTNRMNLPQAIVDAVANDGYSRGDADISVTSLLKPPRITALETLHAEQITEDAAERIWSLMGQAIHTILERANREAIAERRLSIEVEGWKVSGGMDLYEENGTLTDYKTTSVWSVKDGAKEEWTAQLNIYAEILRANGYKVHGLKVIAILRDWSKIERRRDSNYPQSQVVTYDIPLWPEKQAERFLRDRVILHRSARQSLPLCTPEERWMRPTVYAVMKQGRVRAVKLHDSLEAAKNHAASDQTYYVEKRPGENVRCEAYCPVSKVCTQYASLSKLTLSAKPETVI